MPHQFGFFLSTVLTSGCRDTSEYGPVPFASRAVIMSSLAPKFCGFWHRFFSHQALDMMLIVPMCSSSIGLGPLVVNSTVRSSIFFGMPAAFEYARSCDVSARARSKLNTTSSAVKGVPSWNLTPGRSLKRHVVGFTCVHDSASPGTCFSCLSRTTRNS